MLRVLPDCKAKGMGSPFVGWCMGTYIYTVVVCVNVCNRDENIEFNQVDCQQGGCIIMLKMLKHAAVLASKVDLTVEKPDSISNVNISQYHLYSKVHVLTE